MRSKSLAITLIALVSFAAILIALLFARQKRAENTSIKPISQVNDPREQTLKRLEESLRSDGISNISIIATEPITIPGVERKVIEDGLYAIITITSNAESMAGYFDYAWHHSLLMREAILISQNNLAPLVLGEIRILNRSGKLIDTTYCGGEMQPSTEKKYFTEAPKSEVSDEATSKLLREEIKDYPDVTIQEIRVRSGGPAANAQSAEVFLSVKNRNDPRHGLGVSRLLMSTSVQLNKTQRTSLYYFRIRVEDEQANPVAQMVIDPFQRETGWGYAEGITDPDPPGPSGIGASLPEFFP